MKNMKFWRTALVATLVLTVMLSVTGGTIAWFTDEVTSSVNTIKAGNLDIEVKYKNGNGTWADLEKAENLFTTSLWEPGHTQVVYLEIKNMGSLNLMYKTNVAPTNNTEVKGINVAGEEFLLSDYLVFGTTAPVAADPAYADAAAARAAIKDVLMENGKIQMGLDQKVFTTETLLAPGETDYVALVVYMPESVGNEANHKTGTPAPYVELGVTVAARQATVEEDSFGPDYDKEATYNVGNSEELKVALGDINTLPEGTSAKIVLTDAGAPYENAELEIGNNRDVTIELDGNDLEITASGDGVDGITVGEGATLTLTNSGTEGAVTIKANEGENAITVNGGTLNIETTIDVPGNDNTIVASAEEGKQAVINIKPGAVVTTAAVQNNAISLGENATVNMTGGIVKAKYDEDSNQFAAATGVSLDANSAVFNMTDGEIWVQGYHGASGVSTTMLPNPSAKATINITGGKFYVYSDDCSGYMAGVEAGSGSTVNVSGATFDVKAKNAMGASAIYTTNSVNLTIAADVKITVHNSEAGYQNNWGVASWDDVDLGVEYVERTGSFKVGDIDYTEENYDTILDSIVTYN